MQELFIRTFLRDIDARNNFLYVYISFRFLWNLLRPINTAVPCVFVTINSRKSYKKERPVCPCSVQVGTAFFASTLQLIQLLIISSAIQETVLSLIPRGYKYPYDTIKYTAEFVLHRPNLASGRGYQINHDSFKFKSSLKSTLPL